MLRVAKTLITLSVLLILLPFSAQTEEKKPLKLDQIVVRLFHNYDGTLSAPISGKTALWNTIIGEGDAGIPSNATLVDVIVRGQPGTFEPNRIVSLMVTKGKDHATFAHFSQAVGVLSPGGAYHAAFLLLGTGCEELHVSVQLNVTNQRLETEIPFKCGE